MAGLGGGGSLSGAVRAGRAFVELFADDSKLLRAMEGLKARFSKWGATLAATGAKMFAAGLGLATPLALATAIFVEFDDAMRLAGAVSNATADQLAGMTARARELGRTTSFTAAEVAKLMVELGRAGFKPDEINVMTAAVLNLARASGTDAALSAEIMASTLRQFSLDAGQAARVADVLAAAANKSNASVESLGESLKYAGPVAADLGLSLEDAVAFLAVLANMGIKGSEAGTSMRRLSVLAATQREKFLALGVETRDVNGNLRPLVDILDDLTRATAHMGNADRAKIFEDLFGLLGLTGASALAKNVKSVRALREEIANSRGEAARTAQEMDAGVGGAWRRFKGSVEAVAISVGDALAPSLMQIGAVLAPIAAGINRFVTENRDAVTAVLAVALGLMAAGVTLVAFGLGLSAASVGIGAVIATVKLLAAAVLFLLSPIGLVTAAVVGLGYLFVTQTEQGAAYFEWLKGGFRSVADVAVEAWGGIAAALMKGDLVLAGRIAVKGLEIVWRELMLTMQLAWIGLKMAVVDTWHEIGAGFDLICNDMGAALEKGLRVGINGAINAFNWFMRLVLDGAILAAEALHKVTPGDHFAKVSASLKEMKAGFGGVDMGAGLDKIEADRVKRENEILDLEKAEKKARMDARMDDLKAVQDKLAAARADLAALVAAAKAPAAAPGAPVEDAGIGRALGAMRGAMMTLPAAAERAGVKGTFNATYANQQFGADTIAKEQLTVAKGMAADVGEMKDGIADIAKGLKAA